VESAAVVVVRLATLAGGHSGVRVELLERFCALLAHGILPVIPSEGSVGASGDLTPLSYLAAVVMGEREERVMCFDAPGARLVVSCHHFGTIEGEDEQEERGTDHDRYLAAYQLS
jgi:histidine ammonia-lyase